jgi:hypothetical protein
MEEKEDEKKKQISIYGFPKNATSNGNFSH